MEAVEPEVSRVMFTRLFTSCFQGRQERPPRALPSKASLHPAEGLSETESGTSTSHSHQPASTLPSGPSHPDLNTAPRGLHSIPLPALRTKDPDMPKAPRKTKNPAAKPKPAAKSKKKYFSGAELDDDASRVQPKKVEDKLNELFNELLSEQDVATDESKNTMGAESLEGYVTKLGVNTVNYELFVLLDIVQAEGLGQISRKGFVEGWKKLALDKERVQPDIESQKQYVRKRITQTPGDPAAFRQLYQRAFLTGKEPAQRAIDKEVAIVFWDMLFDPSLRAWRTPNVDWLAAWKEFLEARWKRSVNKDMWTQTLAFANKTMQDETLGFWSEDQAWPGVIDEFVAYCKEKGVAGGQGKKGDGMEVDQ